MKLIDYRDSEEFMKQCREFLLAHEAEHNLLLGVAGRLASSPPGERSAYMTTAADDRGDIVAVALATPPFPLILSRSPDEALELFADDILRREIPVGGVLGRSDIAAKFSELWKEKSRGSVTLHMAQRIYRLERVLPPRPVKGELRAALESDLELVVDWEKAFGKEVGLDSHDADHEMTMRGLLRGRQLFLWETDRPVSMAGWAGPTPGGIRINRVYTPPEHRGRGYASGCVAALSQHLLDEGRRYCFLFTDLANTTSNGIYQTIGYEPVCDCDHYRFGPL